ncbi:nitrilase-related carbon-nitrogen hydrolase [Chloroflexota bacterium]
MVEIYTAICMQMNRTGIDHRKEIRKANLDRCLELLEYAAAKVSYREYAPIKLALFPEVFMQGWNDSAAPYSNIYTKVAKDMAIRIPGEETDLLAEKAKQYRIYIGAQLTK